MTQANPDLWFRAFRDAVEGVGTLVPGPQLTEGIDFVVLVVAGMPGTTHGRTYTMSAPNRGEKWVLDVAPSQLRTAEVEVSKLNPTPDPTVNWWADGNNLGYAATWWAKDLFSYQSLDGVAPVSPPAVSAHQYDLYKVSGGVETVAGALYRQWQPIVLPNGTASEQWWEHWALAPGYFTPGPTTIRVRPVAAVAPNLAAYVTQQKTKWGTNTGALYALVELTWKKY
ncbi:MAG: hypothetical protein ABMB14_35955 [Myxococcota bacterium]